ncbi:MAG: class I SAM-dependent methyltransferase [Planctomycetes bacterium]|nr:class I SAM-dependent methyltransferase [Planctomycetota bacterium]
MARDEAIQREWQRLFDRFEQRLRELQPASVLDVGCGRGVLVSLLCNDGILATGVDPAATGQDPQVIKADATSLPFPDSSFEWVTLRHVPHHLVDLPGALRECIRVAREGLLMAEPWFDIGDPVQQVAERWDHWWKRQHERAGDTHKPCLSLQQLVAALPAGRYDIESEHYRHVAAIPAQSIDHLSRPLLDALPEGDPDRQEYSEIEALIRERGFTYNGTLIGTVRLQEKT